MPTSFGCLRYRQLFSYLLLILIAWILVHFAVRLALSLYRNVYEPSKQAVDLYINNVYYAVSYWSVQGGRPYQEDRHHEVKGRGSVDSSLFGIFDGHGGANAAEFCRNHLLQNIVADEKFETDLHVALHRAFIK
jgi:hypothetical protein